MSLSRFRLSERQVLHFIMVVCLIGSVSAFLVVFLRSQPVRTETPKRPIVRWISSETHSDASDIRQRVANMEDPSLMSLPNVEAFSRALWNRQTEPATSPNQPPQSLAYLDNHPTPEFRPLLDSIPLPQAVRNDADKPLAAYTETFTNNPIPPAHSTIQPSNDLAPYPLLHKPPLPTITNETSLRPSVVRLAMAPDGTVRYAMLTRSCGNETADDHAIRAAYRLRFTRPLEASHPTLIWGTARFLWATATP
jgi:hypothetical protein